MEINAIWRDVYVFADVEFKSKDLFKVEANPLPFYGNYYGHGALASGTLIYLTLVSMWSTAINTGVIQFNIRKVLISDAGRYSGL